MAKTTHPALMPDTIAGPEMEDADHLPHDRAVWRDYRDDGLFPGAPPEASLGRHVSLEHGTGPIVLAYGPVSYTHLTLPTKRIV